MENNCYATIVFPSQHLKRFQRRKTRVRALERDVRALNAPYYGVFSRRLNTIKTELK